jgi:hypothetical protein
MKAHVGSNLRNLEIFRVLFAENVEALIIIG